MTIVTKIIIGVVFLGGVATASYFVFIAPKEVAVPIENKQEQANVTSGKKIPFTQFIKQGGSYKCTVSQVVENIESKGTVYVAGELLRGEFTTAVQNMSIKSTFIAKDGYMYTWTSAAPSMGFKAKVMKPNVGSTDTKTSGSYSWNSELVGDYTCEPWALDETKFELPSTVTFTAVN